MLAGFADGYGFAFDDYQRRGLRPRRGRIRRPGRGPDRGRQDDRRRVRGLPGPAAGSQVLLHHPDQGAVEPEVRRPRPPARPGPGRPADRRHLDQLRGAGGGDDHRGAAEHDLRALGDPGRPRLRGDGRGALPGRPVPRRGLGRGDHRAGRVDPGDRPVGDGEQRRGVRRMAVRGPRRDGRGASPSGGRCRSTSTCWSAPRIYDLFADDDAERQDRGQPGAAQGGPRRVPLRPRRLPPAARAVRQGQARRSATAAARTAERPHGSARSRGPREDPSRPDWSSSSTSAGLLPAIVFIFSRVGCDAAVRQLLGSGIG